MRDKATFGLILKRRRQQLGLSQEAFAEKVGVARNTIARAETGKSFPTHDNYIKICSLLGIVPDDEVDNVKIKQICMKLKMLDDTALDFVNAVIETYIKNKV